MEEFARIEYCVLDKSGNNAEVFDREEDAVKFARDKHYTKVLEVGYGEPDENGDEVELYASEIWTSDNDVETFEGTAYYDDKYRGVADTIETSDFAELETWAWNMLQQGLFIEIINILSGKSQRLTPEDITENGIMIDISENLHAKLDTTEELVEDDDTVDEDLTSLCESFVKKDCDISWLDLE